MNNYLFVLVLILYTKLLGAQEQRLYMYVNEQADILDNRLIRTPRDLKTNATEEEPLLLSYQHEGNFDDTDMHVYSIFKKTFININEDIFQAEMGGGIIRMYHYGTFQHPETIFFKVFEHKGMGFMALSTLNEILMYTIEKNETTPKMVQRISSISSADGLFFTNDGSLYFILGGNRFADNMSFISVYKWLGTYFDQVDSFQTPGVAVLSSFGYKDSEIIIAGQNSSQARSSVFQFKKDKLLKIQQLLIENPLHINVFLLRNIPHVLIYEKSKKQLLYKFYDYELIHTRTFYWDDEIDKPLVVYANNTPFIVHVQKAKFVILKPQNDNILPYKTKSYLENYSVILDIDKGANERGNITFIAGLNADNIINISGMTLGAHAEIETEQDGMLRRCFDNLQKKVYDRRTWLNQMNNYSNGVSTQDLHVTKKREESNLATEDTNIEAKLAALNAQLDKLLPILNMAENSSQLQVNGQVVIKGNISSKTIKSNHLVFKSVNGKSWTPDLWLRLNEEQSIKGPVNIKTLKTNVLVTSGNASRLFNDLLRRNAYFQHIKGQVKVKNLVVPRLYVETINDVNVTLIVLKNKTQNIKGVKSFDNLLTKNLTVTELNGKPLDPVTLSLNELKFAPHVYIKNMEIELLDNIQWDEFEKSVFKVGSDKNIEGNLTVPSMALNALKTNYINGVAVDDFLTKTTDQNVTSNVEFQHIDVAKLKTETINGRNISNWALVDQDAIIGGKVKIDNINVRNRLEILNENASSSMTNGEVFGSSKTHLMQRYSGKVLVKGNLYVNDFSINPEGIININGKNYSTNIINEYWTKNTNQQIPAHVEITKGISVPHLSTNYLNDIPAENFALNSNETRITSPLAFWKATINGNVRLHHKDDESYGLTRLISEGVRNDGGRYVIKGRKVFHNPMVVKVFKDHDTSRLNNKTFHSVTIKENLKGSKTWAKSINNITEFGNLINIRKPQNLSSLSLQNASVEKLYVKFINKYSIKEYLEKLDHILKTYQLKALNVKGNVSIQQMVNLATINDQGVQDLLNSSNSMDDVKADLYRDVKFSGKTSIGNLVVSQYINEIDMPALTKRLLHTVSNQSIKARYTFRNLKTEHLNTKIINSVNITNPIDVSSKKLQDIWAPEGINLRNTNLESSVEATHMYPCNIYDAMSNIRSPQSQLWDVMEIVGNVTLHDESSDLFRIIEKSVKTGQENTIYAPVIIENDFTAEAINIEDKLNDINLRDLIDDAVLVDSDEEQIITAHKTFKNSINAERLTVTNNADVIYVNALFIPDFYKRIISKDMIVNTTILGKKTFFEGLQTNKLLIKEIANINPGNIVSTSNKQQIPKATFDSINISNNFNVKHINNFDLDYVLKNRLLTNTTETQVTNAVYYFSDLEVKENINAASINKINLNNVVFDMDKQTILAVKQFLENVTILGNANADYLNDVQASNLYNNSILLGNNETLDGNLTVTKSVKFVNNIIAERINGFPLDDILNIVNTKSKELAEGSILKNMSKIKNIIDRNVAYLKNLPKQLMYIEKSKDLLLGIHNASDRDGVTVIEGYAMIHIISEESAEKCNLTEGCRCPVQHSLEITPHLSVTPFLGKAHQRIFTYHDSYMTVHFTTNSISTSSTCRTNSTNETSEASIMTWSTTRVGNSNGSFYDYPTFFRGYINDVKFFTSKRGATYAVIAPFYDPIADTHKLNCSVIRFSDDRTSASEIQNIPVDGAWALNVLQTAQGTVLVIGSLGDRSLTTLYRFDEHTEEFIHLRHISSASTKIEGVVIGNDSLVILANGDDPVQILKYHPKWDNYYYFQNLIFNERVLGLSVFYMKGVGLKDAYLCVVTEDKYNIYSFHVMDGWKLEMKGMKRGLRNLIPFELKGEIYLFAPSASDESLLKVMIY